MMELSTVAKMPFSSKINCPHRKTTSAISTKAGTAIMLGALLSTSASAVTFDQGRLRGAIDSTFSFGAQWRLEDPDARLISQANGGTNGASLSKTSGAVGDGSSNTDNGNLNYQSGVIANTFKGTQ